MYHHSAHSSSLYHQTCRTSLFKGGFSILINRCKIKSDLKHIRTKTSTLIKWWIISSNRTIRVILSIIKCNKPHINKDLDLRFHKCLGSKCKDNRIQVQFNNITIILMDKPRCKIMGRTNRCLIKPISSTSLISSSHKLTNSSNRQSIRGNKWIKVSL